MSFKEVWTDGRMDDRQIVITIANLEYVFSVELTTYNFLHNCIILSIMNMPVLGIQLLISVQRV